MTQVSSVLQVPAHKGEAVVGAGGEKIKWIQRKSKCRVQVIHACGWFSLRLSRCLWLRDQWQ